MLPAGVSSAAVDPTMLTVDQSGGDTSTTTILTADLVNDADTPAERVQ